MRETDEGPEIISSQEEHKILGISKGYPHFEPVRLEKNASELRDHIALANRYCGRPEYAWKKSFGLRPFVIDNQGYGLLVVSHVLQESKVYKRYFLQSSLFVIPKLDISSCVLRYLIEKPPLIWPETHFNCEDIEYSDPTISNALTVHSTDHSQSEWLTQISNGKQIKLGPNVDENEFLGIIDILFDRVPLALRSSFSFTFGYYQDPNDPSLAIVHSLKSQETLTDTPVKTPETGLSRFLLRILRPEPPLEHNVTTELFHTGEFDWRMSVASWRRELSLQLSQVSTHSHEKGDNIASVFQRRLDSISDEGSSAVNMTFLNLDAAWIPELRNIPLSDSSSSPMRHFIAWLVGGKLNPPIDLILRLELASFAFWEWIIYLWSNCDEQEIVNVYAEILNWQRFSTNESKAWRLVPELCFSAMLVRESFFVSEDPIKTRECPRILRGLYFAASSLENSSSLRKRLHSNCNRSDWSNRYVPQGLGLMNVLGLSFFSGEKPQALR